MSFFDDWWHKRKKKRDDLSDIDSFFDEIFKEFERMLRSFMSGAVEGGPIIRGFSVTIGPDGRPIFREFGPAGARTVEPVRERGEEVEADVVDAGDHYEVIADMPGLSEEDIDVRIEGRRMVIKGRGKDKAYFRVVELPEDASEIIEEKRYVNGVLTVKVRKRRGGGIIRVVD